MSQVLDARALNLPKPILSRRQLLLVALIGLATGGIGAKVSQALFSSQNSPNENPVPIKEIIVPQKGGLQFRAEDGTPLARITKDEYGTSLQVLNYYGKPVVEMSEIQGKGLVSVGTKEGQKIYISALETGGTIIMIGKYNKDALEITSSTNDGSGKILINEGVKGWPMVELGKGARGDKPQGKISIYDDDGIIWHSP